MVLSACGPERSGALESGEMNLGFQMHALECDRAGIGAKLQILGIDGFCELSVDENRIVSGTCFRVPTGQERIFRLIYFITSNGTEVQLATVDTIVNLEGERRKVVEISFPASTHKNKTSDGFDDDGDGAANIEEFCRGTNPRQPD